MICVFICLPSHSLCTVTLPGRFWAWKMEVGHPTGKVREEYEREEVVPDLDVRFCIQRDVDSQEAVI